MRLHQVVGYWQEGARLRNVHVFVSFVQRTCSHLFLQVDLCDVSEPFTEVLLLPKTCLNPENLFQKYEGAMSYEMAKTEELLTIIFPIKTQTETPPNIVSVIRRKTFAWHKLHQQTKQQRSKYQLLCQVHRKKDELVQCIVKHYGVWGQCISR